jgi:hypothetical protein
MVKVNTEVLKDKTKVAQIRTEIKFLFDQIPTEWNGHTKLEYMKTVLRSTIAQHTGQKRKEDKLEVEELELAVNDIENLKLKLLNKKSSILTNEYETKMKNIEIAKTTLLNNLELLRNQCSKKYDLSLKAKWYEYGERSNKFFFNLLNFKNKQKIVEEINDDGKKYVGQDQVIKGIKDFYQNLYSKHSTDSESFGKQDESFFEHCPKLSSLNSSCMDKEITVEEMFKALQTCKDSAPGPDGIPYSVYKTFWPQVGSIIKESWDYSVESGQSPDSHKESVITILPKEGKDTRDIKNWRPITLTNCDAKIITKSLAIRMNQILETIIDPAQTAYVPGRSIMDNLRCNKLVKNYCRQNNISAVLTSLDAKKAFDSVDHKYIELVLGKYGFGNNFIKYFRTIYRNLTAKILVNGYLSESLKIERGVKQGDALSCAIFIICIDPLIRNLNNNNKIEQVDIKNKKNRLNTIHKASGFADDVSIICKNNDQSIKEIFMEYQRLTNLSGLTLNAEKTEILNLNPKALKESFIVNYNQQVIKIKCVPALKICGIYFCNSEEDEYKLNVLDKIDKLKSKLKLWKERYLTLEGKSLILKTFGISQLIYSMQCVQINKEDLKRTEQVIFNFLWGTKNINDTRARDRIKRSIMKNEYNEGGLKITDIECLDKSLKLRQYIKACSSNHAIKAIQAYCTKNLGIDEVLAQEFHIETSEEDVCKIAQETINLITDHTREEVFGEQNEDEITSSVAITQISMTNIKTYLKRKGRVFLNCIQARFGQEGLETYLDVVSEAETEIDRNRKKRLESIICAFPKYFRNAANNFNENINIRNETLTHFLRSDKTWIPVNDVTTKDLQWILKNALNRITKADFEQKTGIRKDIINPLELRKVCKETRLNSQRERTCCEREK